MRTSLMLSAAAMLLLAAPIAAQQDSKSGTPTPQQSTKQSASQSSNAAGKTQPGVRTATEHAAVRAEFYTVRPTDMQASDLIGMDVQNVANEDIGEIKDIILDDGKNIRAIILDVGGFLGIGERSVAVTPASVLVVKESGGSDHAVVNATKETLTSAPEFKAPLSRG